MLENRRNTVSATHNTPDDPDGPHHSPTHFQNESEGVAGCQGSMFTLIAETLELELGFDAILANLNPV